jgi:hypothetical protein
MTTPDEIGAWLDQRAAEQAADHAARVATRRQARAQHAERRRAGLASRHRSKLAREETIMTNEEATQHAITICSALLVGDDGTTSGRREYTQQLAATRDLLRAGQAHAISTMASLTAVAVRLGAKAAGCSISEFWQRCVVAANDIAARRDRRDEQR